MCRWMVLEAILLAASASIAAFAADLPAATTSPIASAAKASLSQSKPPSAESASDDCAHPHSVAEKLVCGDAGLSRLDSELSDSFEQQFAQQNADVPQIIQEQMRWTQEVRNACSDAVCLNKVYTVRLRQVRATLFPNTLSGDPVYQDMVQRSKPLTGATPEERAEFLNKLMNSQDTRTADDIANDIPYIFGALTDPSPVVRGRGAGWLIDESLLPQFIHVMVTDPDPHVRGFAAISISEFITDNGTDDCNSVDVVSKHLDEFFEALKDRAPDYEGSASRYAVEVLGARDAGGMPLPCCMTPDSKQLVIKTLTAYQKDPLVPYYVQDYVGGALGNINRCAAGK